MSDDKGHTRRTQAQRREATRSALLTAARELFAARGYAGTGREDIAAAAGVTRGALYHHFAGKEALFRAVLEDLEREVMERVVAQALSGAGALEQLRIGSLAYLDAALDPAVQRVVLLDAPSIMPLAVRDEIAETYVLGVLRDVLGMAMDSGEIARQPVEALARVLMAVLHECALHVARAEDHRAARAEVGAVVERLLAGL